MGRERQGAYECEVQCRRKALSFLESAAIHVRQTRPRLNTESLLSRLFGAMNAKEYILAILAEYRYIRYNAFRGRYRYPVGRKKNNMDTAADMTAKTFRQRGNVTS
eukprot:3437788-Pleurochrysis_carterae.AAC.1